MSEGSRKPSKPEAHGRPRRRVRWLLGGADWMAVCDEGMRCVRRASIAVDGDTIVAAGPSDEVEALFQGECEIDLTGHLLMPGLVNAHAHAAMSCFRGLADDLPLARWLNEIIFPAEAAAVNPAMVYWGTLLSCVEMLLGGTTTFCDGYFFEEAAARAARDAGIRAVLGQGFLDFPTPDQPEPSRRRERAEAFLESFPKGTGRLHPSVFCHAAYTCGAETLLWAREFARKHGLLFQMHLAETAFEADEFRRNHGVSTTAYLDGLGLLDERTLLAHCIWLDPREIDLIARRGAGVSHNPQSNMKLASGVAPLQEFFAAGIPVGLGTDGCASNNDLDLFSEMDAAAKLQKVMRKDPEACPAGAALAMATRGGAAALGLGREIGTLEAGRKADIVAVDLNAPHLTPLYDPVSHLVYAVKPGDVRHVWVAGEAVVLDRKVQGVDVREAVERVRRIAQGTRLRGV